MMNSTNGDNSQCVVVYTGAVSRGNPGDAGAGVVLALPAGRVLARGYRFVGRCTNNHAEYQALLVGLKHAAQRGFHEVLIRSSSELMINQLIGTYSVNSAALQPLYRDAMTLLQRFDRWHAEHIPRHQNSEPCRLANKAIDLHLQREAIAAR